MSFDSIDQGEYVEEDPDRDLKWFPFYPEDYFSYVEEVGETVGGLYVKMLWHQWTDGSLPSDLGELSELLGKITREELVVLWPKLAPRFVEHIAIPGRLVNPEVQKYRASLN